ncbi:MAG: homoserine O-acetyltransferase [Bacteroidota bacterium]
MKPEQSPGLLANFIVNNLYHFSESFLLESGESLPEFTLAYQTWGNLNADKSNVIWVCHALTANAAVDDWWPNMLGKDLLLDPEKHFIICANMLGSCYGSTHALSQNPATGSPYFHQFPLLTNRDIVRAFDLLRQSLGINRIHSIMGGSLGGQQVLEWAIMNPDLFDNIIPIATNAQHSPWGVAFNESQRLAIQADHSWKENSPLAGQAGLKAARSVALLSYRNYQTYSSTQQETDHQTIEDFRASSYQRYQGDKLVKRFNAFSYWTLSKAMDSQNVARSRNSVQEALSLIQANCLVIGVGSDVLFPIQEQQLLHQLIPHSHFFEVQSSYGHDGFLIETDQISQAVQQFWQG